MVKILAAIECRPKECVCFDFTKEKKMIPLTQDQLKTLLDGMFTALEKKEAGKPVISIGLQFTQSVADAEIGPLYNELVTLGVIAKPA